MNQSCSSPRLVASVLSEVLPRICSIIKRIMAAMVLSACVVTAAAQSYGPAFAKFKREMMPKVGQKITVVGTWNDREKECCFLAFNNWGAYVYPTKESGAHFRNGQTVKVTGRLRHRPEPAAPRDDEQSAPEAFFFDAREVEILLVPTGTK